MDELNRIMPEMNARGFSPKLKNYTQISWASIKNIKSPLDNL